MRIVRRSVLFLILLSLILSAGISVAGAELRRGSAADPYNLPVYVSDYLGSMLPQTLSTFFPSSEIRYRDLPLPLWTGDEERIQLLPEHLAMPYRDSRPGDRSIIFRPLYRATLVIASDLSRIDTAVTSWSEISPELAEKTSLGLLPDSQTLIAALRMAGGEGERYERWIEGFAAFEEAGKFHRYFGQDPNTPIPVGLLTGKLSPDDFPPIMIMWDYQAAQLNIKLETPQYEFHVPEEGSLSVDYGLLSRGSRAASQLLLSFTPEKAEKLAGSLLEHGYRLIDGRSASHLGYPEEEEYALGQRRIADYLLFNSQLLHHLADFRRGVLGHPHILPASPDEEQLLLLLSIPVFFAWIALLYFRLDEEAIQRPMTLLLFWIGVSIILHFIQVMYTHTDAVRIFRSIRFLPIFGMVESWFYTGISLANSRGLLRPGAIQRSWIMSALSYGLGILFVTNHFHGLAYSTDFYDRIIRLGPVFYLSLILLLMLSIYGFRCLIRAQAKIRNLSLILPGTAYILILFANLLFFFQGGSLSSGNFDLMNSVGAVIFLELCFATRLIPVNTGYIKLFKSSPVHLRLLSTDLSTVYPEAKDDIPLNDLKRIRNALSDCPEALTEFGTPLRIRQGQKNEIYYNVAKLSGAYVIWEEDMTEILRLKNELMTINRILEERAGILKREQEFQSKRVSMDIRHKMLQEIENSLEEKMDEIRDSLGAIRDASDQTDFVRHELSLVKIKVSQCKRKSNLLVRADERLSSEEVELIFKEALTDAATAGISGTAMVMGSFTIPVRSLLLFYDYIQDLLQKSVNFEDVSFFISYREEPESFVMNLLYHCSSSLDDSFFMPEKPLQKRLEDASATFQLEENEEGNANLRLTLPKENAHD